MANWNKTYSMRQRLQQEGKIKIINGIDYYQGLPIIHRDSEINGVYLGQSKREAIVVDPYSPKLRELYNIAKIKATVGNTVRKDLILESVFQTVKEAMPIQKENAVDKIVYEYRAENDGLMPLDVFIERRTGVCRQDALACAAPLAAFKREGLVNGMPSVDRNSTEVGGHAWCRYKNSIGEVYILDVAQDFLGRLEKAPDPKRWHYERPEDF